MAQIVEFTERGLESLDSEHTYWAYNAADCLVTAELFETLGGQLKRRPWAQGVYDFERDIQAVALEISLRGILVDQAERAAQITDHEIDAKKLSEILLLYGKALGYESGIKENSPKQLLELFYHTLGLPKQYKYDKKAKEEKLSTDRAALEKLQVYPLGNPLVKAILAKRDCVKKLGVLRSGIDADGRMRFNFNIAGTESGRWSSSKHAFGGGMNAQNITEKLRKMFIAREGYKLGNVDLQQAESFGVALYSGDANYLAACNSGDLHTSVSRLIFTDLPWTGDLKRDKEIAERPFYRQFSYRDIAKRGGHGTNYVGTPRTMAIHLKVEEKIIEKFQRAYFDAFPRIPAWHQEVATEVQTQGKLITLLGRERYFFNRLTDRATIREAVAFLPQSLIADYINRAILRLWRRGLDIHMLAQVHDSLLFEFLEPNTHLALEVARELSLPQRLIDGRSLSIPTELMVGWNWSKFDPKNPESNPDGLVKISSAKPDNRKRTRNVSGSSFELLDRRFS